MTVAVAVVGAGAVLAMAVEVDSEAEAELEVAAEAEVRQKWKQQHPSSSREQCQQPQNDNRYHSNHEAEVHALQERCITLFLTPVCHLLPASIHIVHHFSRSGVCIVWGILCSSFSGLRC